MRFLICREHALIWATQQSNSDATDLEYTAEFLRETEIRCPRADNNHASQPLDQRKYESQKWQRGCLFVAQ